VASEVGAASAPPVIVCVLPPALLFCPHPIVPQAGSSTAAQAAMAKVLNKLFMMMSRMFESSHPP
jgi:hypothetical protein